MLTLVSVQLVGTEHDAGREQTSSWAEQWKKISERGNLRRPSAIRYYEHMGILPAPQRSSGQRRYDVNTLHRLVVIQRAQQTGFTLTEIKQLFFGFRVGTPPSVRWQKLKKRKVVELDAMLDCIQIMRDLLNEQGKCRCTALEECGKKILEKQCADAFGTLTHEKLKALKVKP